MPRLCALFVSVPFLLSGQQRPLATPDSVAALQKQVTDLKKQVQSLDQALTFFAQMYREKLDTALAESVALEPGSQKFKVVTTQSGRFFIRLDQVEPFSDGYRVTLAVGNPYGIAFTDTKVTLAWNRKEPSDFLKYGEWLKTKRSQEFSSSTELHPESWTKIPLVLSDTKPDQLGYIEVKLTTGGVRMDR